MAYKRKYARKKPYTKRVIRRRGVPTKVATIKRIVKKALDRRIEDKESAVTATLFLYQQTSVSIISSYVFNLLPTVSCNTLFSGRIGNEIRVKNFYLNGMLYLNSSGLAGQNPYVPGQWHVRLFIGRLKRDVSTPLTSDLNVLLRTGAATVPFDSNSFLSLCRNTNKEVFTIYYDKIHKIGLASPANTGSTFNTSSGLSNNDFSLSKKIRINCTKMIKKVLRFNDLTTNIATNTGLYIFGGLVNSLASDDSLSLPPVCFDYDIEMRYEDA